MAGPANPHDAELRLCWKICRFGAGRAREDQAARDRVLAWIDRMRPLFPGSSHLEAWARIVAGSDAEAIEDLERHEDFFELPSPRRSFWRPLIQSQPFSCIVPGRTTRERRAILSRLP